MNGKFAGQLTVIEDHFRVADNILQVSDLSSKCLVMFLACWGNSDLQSLGVQSLGHFYYYLKFNYIRNY